MVTAQDVLPSIYYLCKMIKQVDISAAFVRLGSILRFLGQNAPWPGYNSGLTKDEYEGLNAVILKQKGLNGWFTEEVVRGSMYAIGNELMDEKIAAWLAPYRYSVNPKKVAVIMAGNIPLVGFHDFLSVLLSGNSVVAKLSSDDPLLLKELTKVLLVFQPELKSRIRYTDGRIGEVDAVIATGSDNSQRYFEQYFGKYHHLFRGHRTSVAVLDGSETDEELRNLGADLFTYFGLGCRNVTHLIVPESYDFDPFFSAILPYSEVINNNKYANNYDYNKAVYLLNRIPLIDNNFILLNENRALFSRIAMLNYHYYSSQEEVEHYLEEHKSQIQVVCGHGYLPFGKAQSPGLADYADHIDTMNWLEKLI